MIYITGDTHGEQERILSIENETHIGRDDILLICGDFGYIFLNNEKENTFLDTLEKKPYQILFVDGNHENFPAIYSYPEEDWNGGRIHRIRKNIIHLMRGQIYEINGSTFFVMGGAYSIDRYMRSLNYSYWEEELPSNEEYNEAIKNLREHNMKVDYVVSHTAPESMIYRVCSTPYKYDQDLIGFLEWVYREVDFKHWYCGHWHVDAQPNEKISFLWFDILRLDI